jgi:hypothetical protein
MHIAREMENPHLGLSASKRVNVAGDIEQIIRSTRWRTAASPAKTASQNTLMSVPGWLRLGVCNVRSPLGVLNGFTFAASEVPLRGRRGRSLVASISPASPFGMQELQVRFYCKRSFCRRHRGLEAYGGIRLFLAFVVAFDHLDFFGPPSLKFRLWSCSA